MERTTPLIAEWAITVFFLVLGFATLAAYIKSGIEHQARYDEANVPARLHAPLQPSQVAPPADASGIHKAPR